MKKIMLIHLLSLSNLVFANKYWDDGSESGSGLGGGIIILTILVVAFFVGDRETKNQMLSVVFKIILVISYSILCIKISEAITGSMTSLMGVLLFVIFYFVPLIIWWNNPKK